jgi:hypothetical protein
MRDGSTEYGIQVEFELGQVLQAYIPLSACDRLAQRDFPVPITFIYGDLDWTLRVDGEAY